MNRKNIPLLLMLVAGAATCINTYLMEYTMVRKLVSLFVVLVLFYILGSILQWTLDFFDKQNAEKEEEERKEKEEQEKEEQEKEENEGEEAGGDTGEDDGEDASWDTGGTDDE